MKYLIKVRPKFDSNPEAEWFEKYANDVVDIVDNMCNNCNRSFTATYPTSKQVEEGNFWYTINITIVSPHALTAKQVYTAVEHLNPLVAVDLQEHKFAGCCDGDSPHWTHEGETHYYDGSTYISPIYEFHFRGRSDYEIVHVPTYIRRMSPRDQKRYEGKTYMWRCTGSWDNFLEATTIADAIAEFEKYYFDMLWRSVEGYRKALDEAIEKFREFDDYRWRNKR